MEDPAGVDTTVSIRRERLPHPGPTGARWAWDDVLETPPPSRGLLRRTSSFVVRHGFDEAAADPTARVGYATVVKPHADGRGLHVDDRVIVEPRILGPVLRAEQAISRRVEAGSKAGMRLVTKGSGAVAERVGGKSGAALTRSTSVVVLALSWLGRLVRDTIRGVFEAPDRFWTSAGIAESQLAGRHERRAILRGLFSPTSLSREGKAAALFLVLASVVVLGLVASLYVLFVRPELAVAWRAGVGLFAQALIGTILLPLFPEFALVRVAEHVGIVRAVLIASSAMTIGAWLTLFVGDEVSGALKRNVTPGTRLARAIERAESFASRYGFWTAFLILSIPLGPDTLVFYTLATVRTPPAKLLLGTFLGTCVRFSLFYVFGAPYYV